MAITTGHADGALGSLGLSNRTVWGARGRLAWLVDGHARMTAGTSRQPAADYARALAYQIEQSADSVDLSLQAIARRAIHDAPRLRTGPDDPGATAAIALVRTGGEMTEWFVLGDCTVLLPPPAAGEEAIAKTDDAMRDVARGLRGRFYRARQRATDKLAPLSAASLGAAASRRESKLPSQARKAGRLLNKLEAAEAAAGNTPGGPWLAAGQADAALEALSGRYKTAGPVCLASSGAMATPDDWFTWTAVGADLHAATAALAQASGDDATIIVTT